MKMLQHIKFPPREFNEGVRDGTIGETMKQILAEAKPEAVYFTEWNGQRSAIILVEVAKPSDVPRLAEPWFLQFHAAVEFHVVMSPDDLAEAGLEALGKKWGGE